LEKNKGYFKQKEETLNKKKKQTAVKRMTGIRGSALQPRNVYIFFIKKVRARLHISKKSCNFAPYFG